MFPLRNHLLGFLLPASLAFGDLASFNQPSSVSSDADENSSAPWVADGQTALRLQFDTSASIPAGASINSVTIRATGTAISPSYRSEIDLAISDPSGNSSDWDFGTGLSFANSAGSWDSGDLAAAELSGSASGLFTVTFSEDYNDTGNDNSVESVTITVDYTSPTSPLSVSMGAYLNGILPATDPTNGGAQPPATLSGTGAFSNLSSLTAATGLIPYKVNSPLWSDGAKKSRWIAIPSDGNRDSNGERVVFNPEAPWTFPVGTVAVKHFELPIDATNPSLTRRLETRFLVAIGNGDFYGISYRWRADGSEADLLPDGASDVISITNADGTIRNQTWDYPGRLDCRSCHNLGAGVFLGVNTWQLNGNLTFPGDSSPTNQLDKWNTEGLFTANISASSSYPAAVSVDDGSASLELRMRSYLAANCANCHNPASGLNTFFDVRFGTDLAETGLINGNVLYDLGIEGATVLTPQSPATSILYQRVNTNDVHRMPPIGRNEIHQAAVATLNQWIMTLSESGNLNSNPPSAADDEGLTQMGNAITINAFANDIDVDGDSFSLLQANDPSHGNASWSANGQVTYTPVSGYIGNDEFDYQIVDSTGAASQTATIRVVITAASSSNSITFNDRSSLLADSTSYSGVAMGVVDMNQDGRDDIVRLRQARNLYVDYQNANGTFTSLSLGTPSNSNAWGLAIGDTDNNGYPDIITGGYYDGLHYQRANDSGTAFAKTTLDGPSVFLQAVSFADIDNDGWLDLFPCHDVGRNTPYRNAGNGGLNYDLSLLDTTTTPASDNSGNYGVIWTDYDGDGDVDLYISKCRVGVSSRTDPRRINQLFRNDGNGIYTEAAAAAGLADGSQSWTADFADIDNDGDLDCFIGNHSEASRLLLNNGSGTFTEITNSSGINVTWDVIQSIFRDFNNDGWVDLLLTGEQHGIWINDRDGSFTQISNPFTSNAIESAAAGDLNNDGFPDLYTGYANLYNGPVSSRPDKLFLGSPNGNGFLSIRLEGRSSNRLASGTLLELHGPWGVQLREVRSGEGYGITNSFSQRFGMGNTAVADKLVVRWPSGIVDTAYNVSANQFLTLSEGDTATPALTNPGNQNTASNTAVNLQLVASDPDGNTLSYQANNLPSGLSLNANTGRITGTTADIGGIFNVTVSVSDGWSSISRLLTWTVQGPVNSGPTLAAISDRTNTVGDNTSFTASGNDADGDTLTYSAVGLPSGISIHSADGRISGTMNAIGSYQVTVTVNDGALNASRSFDWIVQSPANRAPTLASIANQSNEVGDGIFLNTYGSDADGDTLNYSATGLPAGLNIATQTGIISGNTTVAGTSNTTVTVSDGALSASRSFVWTIEEATIDPGLAFGGVRPLLPTRIEAENFDTGGANVSYYDADSGNTGGEFRSTDVDLEYSQDSDETTSLGWTEDGEWLNYSVQLAPGTWDIVARAASEFGAPGSLTAFLDEVELGTINIGGTGGWYNWQEFVLPEITITDNGPATLRLEISGASYNLNWIEFREPGTTPGGEGSDEQAPFGGVAANLPGRIQAEHFDEGLSGEAAFDLDPENIGGAYRDSFVDLESSNDIDGTFAIGWIENSEWVEYSLNVTPGDYDLTARIASAETSPGLIRVLLNNRELGILTVQGTSDWYLWEDSSLQNIAITESGSAVLRLEFIGGPYNLNWIEFTDSEGGGTEPSGQQPFLRTATFLPGRIQAENYDLGGQDIAYHDNELLNLTGAYRSDGVDIEISGDIDGSFSLGWFDDSEWLEYTVVPDPGVYTITARTAAGEINPGDLRVLLDDTELVSFDIPDTGGPAQWASTAVTNITIPTGGEQVLRIEAVGNGVNLNWIEFTRTGDLPDSASAQEGSNSEFLLSTAFGSWDGSEEGESPKLQILENEFGRNYAVTFLIRLGGWRTETGYVTKGLNYEPLCSLDLQNWDTTLEQINNPSGLPVPPAGFKYVTYRLHNNQSGQSAKAFFKVDIAEH